MTIDVDDGVDGDVDVVVADVDVASSSTHTRWKGTKLHLDFYFRQILWRFSRYWRRRRNDDDE